MFDENNPLHTDDSNTVFTTEGHLLTLSRQHIEPPSAIRRQLRRAENLQCPAYYPTRHPWKPLDDLHGLAGSIRSREDSEFARISVGSDEHSRATAEDSVFWMSGAWCQTPRVDIYVRLPISSRAFRLLTLCQSWDFVFSADGTVATEDPSPDRTKIHEVDDGYVITNVTGLRTHITSRLDGTGYDITKGALIYMQNHIFTDFRHR